MIVMMLVISNTTVTVVNDNDDVITYDDDSRLSPSEVNSRHLIKFNIKRPIEVSQPLQHLVVYNRMCSTFRLAETTRRSIIIGVYVEVLLQRVPVTPSSSPSTAPVS